MQDLRHAVVWWTLAISTEPDMLAKVDPQKQQRAAAVRYAQGTHLHRFTMIQGEWEFTQDLEGRC